MENKEFTVTIGGKEYQLRKSAIALYRDNFDLFRLLDDPLTREDKAEIDGFQKAFRKEAAEIKKEDLGKEITDDLIKTQKDLMDSNISAVKTNAYQRILEDKEKMRNLVTSAVIGGEDIDWEGKEADEVMKDIFEQVKKNIKTKTEE